MSVKMPNTKLVMDLKSGVVYAITLSDDSKTVLGVQDLTKGMSVFPSPKGDSNPPRMAKDLLGTTSFCVDVTGEAKANVDIYTIVWPTAEEAKAGTKPHIGINTLPADLIKAGIAKKPDSLKTSNELEIENDDQLKKAMENINKLIGLGNVKEKLNKQIALTRFAKLRSEVLGSDAKAPSLHMVFTGNPGTGKTTVAREYGAILKSMGLLSKGHCVEVTRKDLVAGFIGQSEGKTQEVIERAKGGVLFIDEAYALIVDGSAKDFGKQVVDQIVAEMENNRDDLVVIVAGYQDPMKKFIDSNPGLKRRFLNYVNFEDFSAVELGDILDFMSKEMDVALTPEARALAVKKIEQEKASAGKAFGNAGTVRNLIELAFENAAFRVMDGRSIAEMKKLSKKKLKSLVSSITVEDVQAVSLSGIEMGKNTVGFDFDVAAAKGAANDDVIEAKPSIAPPSTTPMFKI